MLLTDPPSIGPHTLELKIEIGAQLAGFETLGIIISLSVLAALLLGSALISGSEAAFFSLSPADKEDLKEDAQILL